MMKNFAIILSVSCILLMSSCGSMTYNSTFRTDDVRLNIGMDDLEYIGESEISVSYDVYFGFIKVLRQVNGVDFDRLNVAKTNLDGLNGMLHGFMNKAAYKVIADYPDGEYFQPVYKTKSINRLFLGREITTTAKVRVYKFK